MKSPPVTPITSSWDDLLDGIDSLDAWSHKQAQLKLDFLSLIRAEAAAAIPNDFELRIEESWDEESYRVDYISYAVEDDERAHAYLATPHGPVPDAGFPAVVCLHGTTNWGARQTLGLAPAADDPHADRGPSSEGKDFARSLVKHGYVTISPEHFCAAKRMPSEGPFETGPFYRKHPQWSAVGKYCHDSSIACSILTQLSNVNADKIGVTGHSLGAQGSIWLAAFDQRIQCVAPNCAASTFRENEDAQSWSREHWYIYFPQLRDDLIAGNRIIPDFHEMMALIAPRPLMERFAFNDGPHLRQSQRIMLHLRLHDLYKLYDQESAHAFLVHGDGHSVPDLSQEPLLSWMDRWLQFGGEALGGWHQRYPYG